MNDNKEKCLKHWTGNFGDAYIQRNEFTEKKSNEITSAFQKMIGSLELESILEVGCNVGNNLCGINRVFDGKIKTYGVEPNKTAFDILNSRADQMNLEKSFNCDAFHLPLDDSSIDLVFTSGVLIHIPPDHLDAAIDEIFRVSAKYILCSEYFAHEPEEKTYHGQQGLLFKRDFGSYYMDHFKTAVQCLDYGFLWQKEYSVYDNLNWWLFKKNE